MKNKRNKKQNKRMRKAIFNFAKSLYAVVTLMVLMGAGMALDSDSNLPILGLFLGLVMAAVGLAIHAATVEEEQEGARNRCSR